MRLFDLVLYVRKKRKIFGTCGIKFTWLKIILSRVKGNFKVELFLILSKVTFFLKWMKKKRMPTKMVGCSNFFFFWVCISDVLSLIGKYIEVLCVLIYVTLFSYARNIKKQRSTFDTCRLKYVLDICMAKNENFED